MTKRKLDKSKKTNIKCEHCKWWENKNYCINSNSSKFEQPTNYWIKCEQFEWNEKYNEG